MPRKGGALIFGAERVLCLFLASLVREENGVLVRLYASLDDLSRLLKVCIHPHRRRGRQQQRRQRRVSHGHGGERRGTGRRLSARLVAGAALQVSGNATRGKGMGRSRVHAGEKDRQVPSMLIPRDAYLCDYLQAGVPLPQPIPGADRQVP